MDGPGVGTAVRASSGPWEMKKILPAVVFPVIVVRLICIQFSRLCRKKKSSEQSSGMKLIIRGCYISFSSPQDEEQMETELLGWEINGEKWETMDHTVQRLQCFRCMGSKDRCQTLAPNPAMTASKWKACVKIKSAAKRWCYINCDKHVLLLLLRLPPEEHAWHRRIYLGCFQFPPQYIRNKQKPQREDNCMLVCLW